MGITLSELKKLICSKGLYKEWDEVNAKGKKRHIENPHLPLKRVQGRIAKLLSRIAPPPFLFCPVKGRSYISNARQHVNGNVVRSLDIKEYFQATSSQRVYWFFHKRMRCAPDIAWILTALSTFKGRLPTGSPLSPILAYYAHVDMWEAVEAIVHEAGCTLTLYMDDLTISGTNVSNKVMWRIKRQIHRRGLRYHKEKFYSGKESAEVTGIVIRDGLLKMPNRQHQKIHEMRQRLQRETTLQQRERLKQQLQGRLSQARQISSANEKIR
ncbi:conserved hypothetical protein [Nitrosococcus halophilus Nc 4]|uniref:Reverse transcriptase domain-containing protein n=1 Tax=Nitrosococcus halophilus (strain Nc4) TaxID=472759 RepID=D5BZN5_NITHN|nr:reverse transcriptase family protein [Nitrosococcus halophilus]ADE14330.1 conserved hypothetical protein [Nitrosococcus halophilus Nc 4]